MPMPMRSKNLMTMTRGQKNDKRSKNMMTMHKRSKGLMAMTRGQKKWWQWQKVKKMTRGQKTWWQWQEVKKKTMRDNNAGWQCIRGQRFDDNDKRSKNVMAMIRGQKNDKRSMNKRSKGLMTMTRGQKTWWQWQEVKKMTRGQKVWWQWQEVKKRDDNDKR